MRPSAAGLRIRWLRGPDDPDHASSGAGVAGQLASAGRGGHEGTGFGDSGDAAHKDVGGGLALAFLDPIEGSEQIARAWVEIASRAPSTMAFLERTVNGRPGLVAQHDGVIVTVFAIEVAGDRITNIWAVRNPGKLRPWTTG